MISCKILLYQRSSISGTIYPLPVLRNRRLRSSISSIFDIGPYTQNVNFDIEQLLYQYRSNPPRYWITSISAPNIKGFTFNIKDFLLSSISKLMFQYSRSSIRYWRNLRYRRLQYRRNLRYLVWLQTGSRHSVISYMMSECVESKCDVVVNIVLWYHITIWYHSMISHYNIRYHIMIS